jgi:hypothetical protein
LLTIAITSKSFKSSPYKDAFHCFDNTFPIGCLQENQIAAFEMQLNLVKLL